MVQNWQHLVVALIGAVIGLFIGHYRYRIQYVKALPEYTSIVFVRSRAEYTALALLALVSIASEQHEIPVVGALTPADHAGPGHRRVRIDCALLVLLPPLHAGRGRARR
ncbi:MAG: hypothetical protein H6528_06645 [Actinobacteria bacterium]|nr:hypothetical protein [Actinomycetota bacterium]